MKTMVSTVLLSLLAPIASAAPDEIQVYTDDLNKPGERGLELHINYARIARRNAEYRGEQPPARVLRVTPELSLGLAPHWDAGIYLPVSRDAGTGSTFFDGPKLRLRWLTEAEQSGRTLFYGANLEIANTSLRVYPARWRSELRLIGGVTSGDWLFAVNPTISKTLGRTVDGSGGVDFDFAFKASRRVLPGLGLGVEHYSELGRINRLEFGSNSGQATYLSADFEQGGWSINFGIGHGWNVPSDKLVFKMIVGVPF